MNERDIQTLLDLLDLNGHVDDLAYAGKLATRGQSDEAVYLHPDGAIRVLDKFIAGDISARELTQWAEVVHSLDAKMAADHTGDACNWVTRTRGSAISGTLRQKT